MNNKISNKEYITQKFSVEGYVIGCYDKLIDTLSKRTINRIVDSALSYDWTDLLITSKGKKYIVEISTVDREKDLQISTPKEYEQTYGRKYGEEN